MGAAGFLSWRLPGLRYCMASGFLAFGGLCVWLQTKSVIAPYGLTGRHYLAGKVIQGTIAVLLTWGIQVLFPSWLPRSLPAAAFPNHTGLLRATAIVTALFLCAMGIWCLQLRKRLEKKKPSMYNNERMMWEETYMLFRKKIPAHANTAPTASAWRAGKSSASKRDFWRETAPAARLPLRPPEADSSPQESGGFLQI